MNFTFVLIIAVFLSALPFLIHKYKWYWMISGYTTMPKEKRESINWAGFSLFMRNAFFVCSFLMIAGYWLFDMLELKEYFPFLFLALVLGTAIIAILFGNKRFKNQSGSVSPILPEKASKRTIVLTFAGTAIFIAAIFFFGMYGFKADWNKIKVDTVSELPEITMRTNGFQGGGVLKGHFKTRSGEVIKLFIHKNSLPYIRITGEGLKTVYLNFKSPEKTLQLLTQINSKSQ
ncbi:MAG: DUF3784 domain-containing protein [Bacteroidales bacterium]|nr:DUF3784 domain-containing protein [Bacteroidales bacterium]